LDIDNGFFIMQFFVTGTDTNIGKTFVSSVLCQKYYLNYFKPIQTGSEVDSDANFIQKKIQESTDLRCNNLHVFKSIYSFKNPLSPLSCSILEKREISLSYLISETNIILKENKNLIIEGAGGIYVPIVENFFFIDYIEAIKIPAVVVVEDKLGCLNHAILTIKALKERRIEICKVIINKIRSRDLSSNFSIIVNFLKQEEIDAEIEAISFAE
jgi:dethiobiotin synthase